MDKEHPPIPLRISLAEKDLITPDTPVIRDRDSYLIGHLHYGESSMINRLTWMPYVQILGIGFLALIGWLGFRSIKNSEQQHIWVGIAKETAHQLGTPISSLLGWLELTKTYLGKNGRLRHGDMDGKLWQVISEMESDTQRLSKIASRFSQIGSIPELRSENLSGIVEDTIQYFNKRLPHLGRDIQISEHYGNVPDILVNKELLGWALENLFKNAVDAIDHKGGLIVVSVRRSSDGEHVNVYITDNGKGMDQKRKRMIFRPGYTTKGRGWGLGLNFVKRIIEGYHGGRILVQESAPGEGTTIKVMLPIREDIEQGESSESRPPLTEVQNQTGPVAQG
jgi:signal transduction histidine kinase